MDKMCSKTKNSDPLLSVVMPVHNVEKYLGTAIKSVLRQSYKHFEFFIINDGSTDGTGDIINKYAKLDKRIKPIRLKKKGGISNAMNVAIRKAKGKFIVRADGDDICLSNRFKEQVNYLSKHPEIDVLGTYFCLFLDDAINKCKTVPAYADDIYNGRPPVHHPTCIIKRNIFQNYGTYKSKYNNAEDVELWFRWFSHGVRFYNLPKVFYKKRIHSGAVSVVKIKHQTYLLLKINLIALFKYRIRFSIRGYSRVLEQMLYLVYLLLRLDKIYKKSR